MTGKDDGPPKADAHGEGLDNHKDGENGAVHNAGEDCEEDDDNDSEPPPSMRDSSGSEGEMDDYPSTRVNIRSAAGKWSKSMPYSPKFRTPDPVKQVVEAMGGRPIYVGKFESREREPTIWAQFVEYRSRLTNMDRLGIVALKTWEAIAREGSIPPSFITWYTEKIKRRRSVPQAVTVAGLPSGFAEFCHWVTEESYTPSSNPGGQLKGGFQAMARHQAAKVLAARCYSSPSRIHPSSMPKPEAAAGNGDATSTNGENAADGANAENSSSARKRERRIPGQASMVGANGTMAEKMQNALATLEEDISDIPEGHENGQRSAAGMALRMGVFAEEEIRKRMSEVVALEHSEPDLNFHIDEAELPQSVRVMLEGMTRARTYRRRAERQYSLLESELERCFARMIRVEAQYHSLVAETTGRENSLEVALSRAKPLSREATNLANEGHPSRALDEYSNVIKFLEVHVDVPPQGKEPEGLAQARETLGLALCNRSVVNFTVGNVFNGKLDAKRAADVWQSATSVAHLERSLAFVHGEGAKIARPDWKVYPLES